MTATTPVQTRLPEASLQADRYPSALAGRPFVVGEIEDGGPTTVGRIGSPERVHLEARERVLGVVGDHVVTAFDEADSSTLHMYAFGSDAPVIEVRGGPLIDLPGVVAGTDVLAATRSLDSSTAPGVIAFAAGASRWHLRTIIDPTFVTGGTAPVRTIAVSEDATEIGAAICEAGTESAFDCRRTSLIEIASGAHRATVTTGGHPISNLTRSWLLWREYGIAGAISPSGTTLWEKGTGADSATYVGYTVVAADSIVAEISRSGEPRFDGIVAIDPMSGTERVLATFAEDRPRRMWPSLSTDTFVAVANDDESTPPCAVDGPRCTIDEGPVIDAAVLNVASGTLTEHAIHITITP